MEKHVGKKLHTALQILSKRRGIDAGLLLGGVGVELAAHAVDAVEDMEGFAFFGAFENGVFDEMGKSLLVFGLVAGAHVDINPAMHHGRRVAAEHNAYPVLQSMVLIVLGVHVL